MRTITPKTATLIPPEAKRVFKGIIYDVYHWPQKQYDGSIKTFEMLRRPDTVVAIPIKDNKIVITKQEQPSHKPFFDVPGGIHDVESEDELAGVKREVLEETGMKFRQWRLLDVKQTHNKIEHFIYIFLAYDFEAETAQTLDAGEKIEVQLLALTEVKQIMMKPEGRFIPRHILENVSSIDALLKLPEYTIS